MFRCFRLLFNTVVIVLLTAIFISGSVYAQGLAVEAEADPPHGEIPTTVQFTATVIEGEATSFHWEFGDGETCDEQNCEYTYEYEGLYRVKLTVQDADGNEVIEIITVEIEEECLC